MQEKTQKDILQEIKDSDFIKKRLQDSILLWMNDYYKKENDKRSRMGEKFKINEAKVWCLEDLTEDELNRLYKNVEEKLKKCKKTKEIGFFNELDKKLKHNEIVRTNIEDLKSQLKQHYSNCIVTKNKKLLNRKISKREIYNKNGIICLIYKNSIKFFIACSVVTYTRVSLEKYNKVIKKQFIYREI